MKSSKGHIVIHNQKPDQGHTGLFVVSNTTPMDEIDGPDPNLLVSDDKRKKNAERVQQTVEKNIRIKSQRLNSATSTRSERLNSRQSETEKPEEMSPRQDPYSPSTKYNDQYEDQKVYEVETNGRIDEYKGEEDNIICHRFPHLKFCACGVNYDDIVIQPPVQVYREIYISTLHQSLITQNLLKLGITHIMNLTAMEFTKREKYFKYLTLDVYDTHDEDIKKHFRISNRFISDALNSGGKILVHSFDSRSRAPAFILAYLINSERVTLKNGLDLLKKSFPDTEINVYFFKQLEQYDLEKLAITNKS
jgi:protein-tyrosine phosphatase